MINREKGNLLLVDDEIELSLTMKELLEDEASEIYIATNGQEALVILERENIDCVVSDIKMPIMDGLVFIKLARERGFDQPIIFFTGHGNEKLRDEMKAMGATDLLMKPNFIMLELAIRKHMASLLSDY